MIGPSPFAGIGIARVRNQLRAVPRVADALGYTRPPGEPRSLEGILKKQRRIEFLASKLGRQPLSAPETFVLASVFVHRDPIGITLTAIQIRHPRTRQNHNLRLRPAVANRPQSAGMDITASPTQFVARTRIFMPALLPLAANSGLDRPPEALFVVERQLNPASVDGKRRGARNPN